MEKTLIYQTMAGPVEERGCFITDITVSPDNDIVMVMDDCVAVNDAFLAAFDQDKEDYSLTVTSAGLDQPFKIVKQYVKAVGTKVVVKTRDGRKITGKMEGADENGFTVSYEVKEAVPGKKKKELVRHEETFAYGDVNSVMPHIDFE